METIKGEPPAELTTLGCVDSGDEFGVVFVREGQAWVLVACHGALHTKDSLPEALAVLRGEKPLSYDKLYRFATAARLDDDTYPSAPVFLVRPPTADEIKAGAEVAAGAKNAEDA
jgi:hypothetical protein